MPGVPRVFTSCTPPTPAPPAPYPGSDAPAAPAAPAVGKCSAAVENASLLYGFPKPDLVLGATVPSAAACAAACAAQDCCSGWTWHDATCGGYEFRCYFVANPLQVWSRAVPQIGHYSGLCNHGDAATEPCNGAVSPRRCFARNVSCRKCRNAKAHRKRLNAEVEAAPAVNGAAMTQEDKLAERAKRFGVEMTEEEKKKQRANRFGVSAEEESTTTSGESGVDAEKLKSRAKRFGLPDPSEEESKKAKRLERFGDAAAGAVSSEEAER